MLAGEYSINAKLLYGFLLNRTMLSQKSGWVSEDGNVYVIYTIKQMADDLDRSERTVKTALRELENAGLITRVRQGWNQANRIFLQIPDRVQVSSRPEGNICPMDVQDSSPCMGQKLPTSNTDTEYKKHSKTERVESTRRRYGKFHGNVKKCAVGKHPKSEKHGNTAQFSEVERSGTQENCGGIGSGCRLRLRPLPVLRRRQSQRVARIDPNAVVVDKNIAENDRFDLFSR